MGKPKQEDKLQNNFELRSFYLAFSSASRFIRKSNLDSAEEILARADSIRKGFQPQSWNLLQCVRTYFLLMLPQEDAEAYEHNLTKLHETADVEEQVTLYAALPLLPYPSINSKRAAEGIRTNITDVFDAIALDNPYPADFLNELSLESNGFKSCFYATTFVPYLSCR
ncbi:EboA domain-containing protein [Antarcticibacterium sp. 1MA-6-2]|uniref:EboA domain-containing protein n=1 Tax=Antarcticibacterium sp. 1MA-6-2 TaxID=2908210 RepID=UPI0021084567|nr:EboA domain-containing protein [Antarcticibacterium sp. 1MA-6-2]